MPAVALDTVFKTYAQNREDTGNPPYPGSITITGGTINVYFWNEDAEPANAAAMQIDTDGPFDGVRSILPAAKWVLFESASGTPVVSELRVTA